MTTSPSTPRVILEDDARAMVRLLGDIAAMSGNLDDKRRALMEGLRQLLQADSWAWSISSRSDKAPSATSVNFIHGGYSQEQVAILFESFQDTDPAYPHMTQLMQRVALEEHFTVDRRDLSSDNQWYQHAWYRVYGSRINGAHYMYSIVPQEKTFSAIAVHRKSKDHPFTEREAQILHIIIGEVAWMHRVDVPDDAVELAPKLSPRQRAVLSLLLEGQSRKQIAHNLGLSPHTVADHAKAIYRHFDVGSQPELLHRFMVPRKTH